MKQSKRYRGLKQKVEARTYPLDEAVAKTKELANAGFDESIDLSIKLSIAPKKTDQFVRIGTKGIAQSYIIVALQAFGNGYFKGAVSNGEVGNVGYRNDRLCREGSRVIIHNDHSAPGIIGKMHPPGHRVHHRRGGIKGVSHVRH